FHQPVRRQCPNTMQMVRHNNDGLDTKRFALFNMSKSFSLFIDVINQQVIVVPFGKINGKKPHGIWYVKTSVFCMPCLIHERCAC
ncbi:hypothetical protein, partial [Methylomonas koyamae]|uniref:hypothetical protein n=1 Tax=Methylomonas koyamae TaxID=702114 RepID=UPI001E5C9763